MRPASPAVAWYARSWTSIRSYCAVLAYRGGSAKASSARRSRICPYAVPVRAPRSEVTVAGSTPASSYAADRENCPCGCGLSGCVVTVAGAANTLDDSIDPVAVAFASRGVSEQRRRRPRQWRCRSAVIEWGGNAPRRQAWVWGERHKSCSAVVPSTAPTKAPRHRRCATGGCRHPRADEGSGTGGVYCEVAAAQVKAISHPPGDHVVERPGKESSVHWGQYVS